MKSLGMISIIGICTKNTKKSGKGEKRYSPARDCEDDNKADYRTTEKKAHFHEPY